MVTGWTRANQQRSNIVSNTVNMSGDIRALSPSEIEAVSGGWAEDYKSCDGGLVPHYVDCSTKTWGDIFREFLEAGKGKPPA
jgi:hypothetical protein